MISSMKDESIFKAYDIRGIYPKDINEDIAYKIGQGYVEYAKPEGEVMAGMDVRLHSESLKKSLIEGITDAGVDVVDVGLMTTDMLYFGVGNYRFEGGIQSTASHNPPEWHGFKMVEKGPTPTTIEHGIGQVRDFVQMGKKIISEKKGSVRKMDIWEDYCKYILTWIDPKVVKPMTVAVNPNFGLGGKVFEKIIRMGKLPLKLIKLNFEPDGRFPKGRPDPFIPENRVELSELVESSKADFGIAWDADSDRVFFCADGGLFLEPYYLNTVLIKQMLTKFPHEKVVYDPRYTWALIEAIKKNGGTPVISKVGHSYIKEKLREVNALYGTESSGHTYYRDYWYSDCGMIPPMQILEFLGNNDIKLSEAVNPVMRKYFISGEINSDVTDKEGKMEEIAKKYSDGKISRLDGVAVEYSNYRFCVRPSNTENLLRLTLEAKSEKLMEEKRDEVLAIIRS
jgi:phosphomannomutase